MTIWISQKSTKLGSKILLMVQKSCTTRDVEKTLLSFLVVSPYYQLAQLVKPDFWTINSEHLNDWMDILIPPFLRCLQICPTPVMDVTSMTGGSAPWAERKWGIYWDRIHHTNTGLIPGVIPGYGWSSMFDVKRAILYIYIYTYPRQKFNIDTKNGHILQEPLFSKAHHFG